MLVKILRGAARKQALDRYFTGRPCVRGHLAERYTKTGQCVQCEADRRRQPDRRVKENAASRAYYAAHKHDPKFWAQRRYLQIGNKARKQGIPFSITAEDIFRLIPHDGKCPVLGIPLVFGGKSGGSNSASVDRIFPSLGYVRGNICVISMRANRLKYDVVDPHELRRVANFIEQYAR